MYAIVQYDIDDLGTQRLLAAFLFNTCLEAETEVAYHEQRQSRFKYALAEVFNEKSWNGSTIYAVVCNGYWDEKFEVFLASSREEARKNKALYDENCSSRHTVVSVIDSRPKVNGEKLSKTEVVE